MHFTSIPFLVLIIIGFLVVSIERLRRKERLNKLQYAWLNGVVLVLAAWGASSGYWSIRGVYVSPEFLNLAPGYWLPFVPVFIVVILIMIAPALRQGLRILVDNTPARWFIGIHQLRILALGSIIKASNDLFPTKFSWYVGIPDLLFGISAIWLTAFVLDHRRISDRDLMLWHVTGAVVILVPAFGLMHVYMKDPLFTELFVFPMALAPTFIVPVFVMLNLLVVWRLSEKYLTKRVKAAD
ncbi:MAG TPA: hypothetical protein ENJ84_13045 [Gammaproteobacteria bacterium]|nr:hypothetical protein [Gammaproteobacteria bacterium]